MSLHKRPRAWLFAASAAFILIPGTSLSNDASAVKPTATPAPAPVVRISPERLEMLRRSMLSQLAVYEAAEGAMRQPTAAEAQALTAGMVPGAERVVALPGGGAALHRDLANLNFLVVDIGADGKKTLRHGHANRATASKGGKHVH